MERLPPSGKPAALARDAQRGVWECLEAGVGNGITALLAEPVGARLDLGQGSIYLCRRRTGLGRKDQIQFPIDVGGAALAAFFVELDIARFVFQGKGVRLGFERLGRAYVLVLFFEQQLALLLEECNPVGSRFGGDLCRCLVCTGRGRRRRLRGWRLRRG